VMERVGAGPPLVQVRGWDPLSAAAVVFAGGPALFGKWVAAAATERQVVDVGGAAFGEDAQVMMRGGGDDDGGGQPVVLNQITGGQQCTPGCVECIVSVFELRGFDVLGVRCLRNASRTTEQGV
jgi:hypothetical protein